MKILLMTPVWGQSGGREQYVLSCVEEFTRMGHKCAVVYGRMSSKPWQKDLPSIRQHQITTYSDIISADDSPNSEQLARFLHDELPDVIFMTDVRNLALLAVLKTYGGLVAMSHDDGLTCTRGIRTTYVTRTICTHRFGIRCLRHGCFLRHNPVSGDIEYKSFLLHNALLRAYKDIGIHLVASNYLRDNLLQHGFTAAQVKAIGNFTDLVPSPTVAVDESVLNITFVGRIDRYKGVDYLLRALSQVSAPFRCCVIGDGKYLPLCKRLSKTLGISDRVDFTGWLSRDALTYHLVNSAMVVVPSIWNEQFTLVGLEAMMCSRPVVAFDVGGNSDWLKDGINGYLVPVKRVDLLAQRIGMLLRDRPKAVSMGAEGFRLVTKVFSKERHFEHLLSAFEIAAHTKRRSATGQLPVLL